jgi:glycosyltransferase involved in cell wall biosynthesis
MPDCRPDGTAERIRAKSRLLSPGLDLAGIDLVSAVPAPGPPIILWNHRWEFDKAPEVFFAALDELTRAAVPFRLALLGDNAQAQPQPFLKAREQYGERIVRFGYEPERHEYLRWLRSSAVHVSTAVQENFGMAAVEAVYAGAYPIWPDRLSYPELLPPEIGRGHLYSDFSELVLKLKNALLDPGQREQQREQRRRALFRFDWSAVIGAYDEVISQTARERRGYPSHER